MESTTSETCSLGLVKSDTVTNTTNDTNMLQRPAPKPRGETFNMKVKSTIIASPAIMLLIAAALVERFQYKPPITVGTKAPTPALDSVSMSLSMAGFSRAKIMEITPNINTHIFATLYCFASSAFLFMYFLYTSVEISALTACS